MTTRTNGTANTDQQGITEDSALSPERATKRVEVSDKAQRAKAVTEELSHFTSVCKNELLLAVADALITSIEEIPVTSARDTEADKARSFSNSLLDCLRLDTAHVEDITDGLRQVATLPDPVGEMLYGDAPPNGIELS